MVRTGQSVAGAEMVLGLTCQQQQQLPEAVLVQVQGILLLASFFLLQPEGQHYSMLSLDFLPIPPGLLPVSTNLGHGS